MRQLQAQQRTSLNFRLRTEKAIQAINRHELQAYSTMTTKFMRHDFSPTQPSNNTKKQLMTNHQNKIQIMSNRVDTYQIQQTNQQKSQGKNCLKVIIKNLRGKFTMVMTSLIFINNEYPLPIDADNCIKKMYLVDRDHIFYMQTVERISDDDHRKEILTFNNGEHLSFFSLKYQYVASKMDRKRMERIVTEGILSKQTSLKKGQRGGQRSDSLSQLKSLGLRISQQLGFAHLNKLHIENILQTKLQNKLQQRSIKQQLQPQPKITQQQRVNKARAKLQQLQQYDQKQLQLKATATRCKQLIDKYRLIFNQNKQQRKIMIPKLIMLFHAIAFIGHTNARSVMHSLALKRLQNTKHMVNLFITTLKTRTTSFLILQPNLKLFHLSTCHEVFIMNTNISHKQLLYNAGDVIIATLKLTAPRSALNIAFEAANAYRRAIRTIQRQFLSRHHARIFMLQTFTLSQTYTLVDKFPHFSVACPKFNKNNIKHDLAYQYLASETDKMYAMPQIKQFTQMNDKIVENNKLVGKKNQKKLLEMPDMPNKPRYKYFCNLLILKGMIRNWFELQSRKCLKRAKAQIKQTKIQHKQQTNPNLNNQHQPQTKHDNQSDNPISTKQTKLDTTTINL